MYDEFYNLKAEPFRLSPDARMCYRHPSYKKAKAYMQYALHRGEGFVMVTGEPGTGKSTLIDDLTSDLADGNTLFADLVCTQIEADDLLRLVVMKFGLEGRNENKALLLHDLEAFLVRLNHQGRRPLLIIDEAQDLPESALEELRLLTNLNRDNRPLLQIFLVGQEELRHTVLLPSLKQLHQRIVAACHLKSLDSGSTEAYVKHRLSVVGWQDDPQLDDDIFQFIHRFSQGVPRLINLICGRLLLHGMVEELHRIDKHHVREVIEALTDEHLLPQTRELTEDAELIWG